VTFRVLKPPAQASPQPTSVTLPSVVGQHLDKAMDTLYGLGLKHITVVGPTAMAADQKVDAQDPRAGTVVMLTDGILLSTSLVASQTQTGVQKIVVSNQSNRAKPMDLWLFDYTTGTWNKSGSVAYQGQTDVDLTDSHTFTLAAVDPTLLNCHTGRPDEAPCVYQSQPGTFVGDSNGLVIPWQIL
jgi:beta-lactam-binding protein with PASTA domain